MNKYISRHPCRAQAKGLQMSESKLNGDFNADGVNLESHEDTAKNNITELQAELRNATAEEISAPSPIGTGEKLTPTNSYTETDDEASANAKNEAETKADFVDEAEDEASIEIEAEDEASIEIEAEAATDTEDVLGAEPETEAEENEPPVITDTEKNNDSDGAPEESVETEGTVDLSEAEVIEESADAEGGDEATEDGALKEGSEVEVSDGTTENEALDGDLADEEDRSDEDSNDSNDDNSDDNIDETAYEEADEDENDNGRSEKAVGTRFIDSLFDFIELFIFSLAAVFIITTFFFRHSVVDGTSMERTLFHGEHIIISDLFYKPERGDIIVCEDYSTELPIPIVKRVIAIAGDRVEIDTEGNVKVNGVLLDESGYVYIDPNFPYHCDELSLTVPEGEIFVMGDHRNVSSDSRKIGTIKEDSILGKVLFRFYPFDKFGAVE